MATSAEQAFYKNQGVAAICASFLKELKSDGKLKVRGHKEIDAFVSEVNAIIQQSGNKG